MTGRWLWPLFAVGAAAVFTVLVWISADMIDLEHSETLAKDRARYEEEMRLALARLDRTFARLLEREAERPPSAYRAYSVARGEAWRTKDLKKLRPGQVYTPSPVMAGKPEFIRLHFQVDPGGRFTSPQVPTGAFLDICELPAETIAENRRVLAHIATRVDAADLPARVEQAEAQTFQMGNTVQSKRQQVAYVAKTGGRRDPSIGPLEPMWLRGELFFLRRVRDGASSFLQGFLIDWNTLRGSLTREIEDLFPEAALEEMAGEHPAALLSLPALLKTTAPAPPDGWTWTATHTALLIMWAVVLVAMAGAALAFRHQIDYGKKQRRFASLVTHELRSPLTTFRLYADLLAEGLVRDEGKREDYYKTLQRQADHMARMVENVIAHARVEEGRAQLNRQRLTLGNLIEKVRPDLAARAAKAGLGLVVEASGGDVALETDPDAVEQILNNLVENACRYGASKTNPTILLGASVLNGSLRLCVRDHGAGVPADVARLIFLPFERGKRDESDPERGLGVGLALSRGLARDLGGDLELESPEGGGARFVLTLPVAS